MPASRKVKLTLSVDRRIRDKAHLAAKDHNATISGLVEKFLGFLSDPFMWCFKCGKEFSAHASKVCPRCTFLICPDCESCRCGLSDESAVIVFQMNKIYDYLLGGKVK